MNEDAIKDAYDLFVNTGYNKSYDNFKTLIQSNPNARKDAYDLFVGTGYNKTQKDFDELMGIGAPASVKKKESVSPSQQSQQPTLSATGEMGPDGAPVPSAKKGPSLQEQLQSGINLAASAAVASSKPGFTPVPKEQADKALYGKAKVQEGTLGLSGGRTKDVIISSLNEDFGKLGVRFEQPQNPISRSMGDIVATADNGQSITIQASSDGKAAESESKRLQSFLMGNSAGVEKKEVTPIEMLKMMQGGIAENEQEKFKRVYTPEMINETIKFVNDEVTKANKKLQDISGQIDEINNEAARITGITGAATPESQARMQKLTASYDLLKDEFDKERENAQVISKLGVEGINIASAEHLKLLEQKGGFGKSIYNHTVEMLGNTANGILQMATLGILDEGGKYAQETIDQFKKDTKFSDTEVYEQNSNMAMQVLFSMPEWLPMAAMGPAVGTTFMFTQGVGRKVEELNNNPETKDLSQLEKLAIVSPMAYVEARLENLGLSAWLSKNKGIAASIAIKAVANVSPKAGAAGIARLINTEINNLAVKGLLNVTGASLAEAETGALQYVAESGMKELYNIAEQRQIFKQPEFGSEAWAKELAESAIMEGLGGAFVSGPINIAQQTANYAVGKSNTNETFKIVKDLLNDNIAERSMIAQLNSAVNEGKISKEKAQTTLYNFREAKSIVRDIPQDLSEDNQRKAFDLIAEKRKLSKQIEGKDPSLVDKQKTRITAIDQELKNISNAVQEQTTSEVPVQPGAAVSGEVAQGEPQVVTEEGKTKEEVERKRQEELFDILSEEDKQIASKIPEGDKRNKWVKTRVSKTTKGTDAIEKHNAEDALNTSTDVATRIAAKRKLESNQPFNAGSIADINKVIFKIKNNQVLVGGENLIKDYYDAELAAIESQKGQAQEEVAPGSKAVISGVDITYPTQEQRAERETVRNSQEYVNARSIELPVTDTEILAEDLNGEFAMVTGENPKGEPLTEEENQALNQKAQEWLTSRGYDPKPIVGKFNQAENSFFVKGMTEADAIEFAQEFDQKSVAHSGGMLYQDGSRNPRTAGDDFTFGKFEPGMDMVSIVNTTDGPRQFSVAYDFKTTIESDTVSDFDQAAINSAQSLKLVAPDLKIIVAENTEDAQLQIAEALSAVAPSQAADVAEGFTTETRGQTVFVNGKPFAIILDKSQADTVTIGHEVWETLLNDAFGDDQAKFKEFRDEIDRQLRLNGFEDIAKALTDFSNQRGYEDVKYSEYMAELGGMLVANGFKKGSLDAKQKSLLQKIGDVINKFAQLFTGKKQFLDEATPDDILGFMITISEKVAKGEDVSSFFRGKATAVKEGVTSKSQIDQRLSEPGIEVPKNEKLSAKINPSKEGDVMKQIDALLDKYPNALKDRNQWKELMSRVFSYKGPNGEVMIPKFPEALSRMSNSVDEVLKELSKVSDKQRELASSGLEGTKEIGKLYKEGKMDETDTGLYFLWNIMSIGISPYPQEAGFLRAVENGVDSFIRKSAEGKFLSGKEVEYNGEKIDSGLADYYAWVDQTLPKGVAGSGSKANLRSFGSAFLSKASTKIETGEFRGLTKMEALHKILSDRTTPTNELRRKWLSNLSGMSFNNKIFDFILLTTGRSDLFVIDRVRTEHFWDSDKLKKDSGLKPTTSIYDGSELAFGKTTGAGYSKMLSDVPGLVFAELANRTMQPVVKEAYKKIGVKDSPDVGRFHWETWVAASSQEVSHGSIDAIVQRKASGGITDAGIRQGKYGAWDFNFAYRKRAGKPFMYEFTDEDGNVYEFDDIAPIYEEISNQNQKKNYGNDSDRFILKDENGNIIKRKTEKIDNAWYDQPGVDKQKYFDYLKSQAKEVIPAPNVVEDQGVVIEKPKVTTKSQKSVPAVVDEVLTDDGKGNYVFVHYSEERRDTIKPMSGSNKNFTSREEVAAISSVGGVSMYYTKQGQKEQGVGNVAHTVLIPKDKVYFYGTTEKGKVSNDPENFEPEARRRFQEYKNRNNPTRPTTYAFDSNNSAAWVGKVASENGYDMLVTNWGGPKSYRAQSVKEMTPETDYTGFKEIPESNYEVGDEIFVYGSYGEVTGKDGDVITYQTENSSGKFDTKGRDRDRLMLIQKAKPTVTTKSQKVIVDTIPGYDRMMGEVEGILDKTMNRTGSYNQASANAIGYIQKSAVYERADDSQREQIIRDFVKIRGEKIKVAPSVGKILGQIKDTKKVTVNERTALKDQIKLEAKAAKDAVAFVKQLRVQMSSALRGMAGRGVISAKQAASILSRYDKMNILNPDMRDRFVDYMSNVFQSAEYADKVKQASKLRSTIKKAAKSPDNQAENSKQAKVFAEIDPSRVADIDEYINNAEQVLSTVSRKTGTVKMRNIVNMPDTIAYIDGEIQAQREQIKNEILSKYQDLVDAGVLDSKMTINEIKKVVAAIEENEDESTAKAKEAKDAVKQMMDELSPILLQIARTGEDPFTGDPIDLTPDERAAIVKLAKMDIDSLSLAEAIKVIEYANNFIANGVTSGIVGMVDLYQGSLNAEELVKKGFKSIPFKKYFSKGAGRVWAEQIASLPMLAKLMWGSTSRALTVSVASGVTGVSNGKAKAIKIVEKAVKEYVSTFSKTKDFLSSENVIERGMLAFVSRSVVGDEFQVQDEFNRRKSLVEETIQALKDPDNSTEAEIKKGEVVEKVYNKILKDAKNAKEVRANVSEINKKAVDWWVNEWSKHYDRMDEVSRNVYNTLLSRDSNFTPDRFQLKEVSPAAEGDFDSGFFGNFENVSTEKSGSLKENKRIKNLPQNKNGVKTRIVNLDFDINNVNALTNAIVDVETAGSVMQMKGFVTSKDFSKLFSSKEDRNLYKKRLVSYVNRAKGQGYIDTSELKSLNRLANAIASFGTAKALFSLSQPFKQSIPPLLNTLVQTGRIDVATLFKGGFSFIDRTGYPIANRGISSQGELKSINRQLVEADKNLLLRGLDGVAQYSNLMLEITLKYPDIATARASWLSFYKKGLKKEGIKTSDINWITHEVNSKAADYAQMMIDSQQNISDSDMQGEFLASKDPAKAFLRRAIFPLMTFVLNQKTRIWADIRTISNKDVTTVEDRQEALLSLSGALVELGVFSAISLGASTILYNIATSIFGDDEEDKEEDKKKMIMRRSAYTAQNFMKDFFLPPIPGMDLIASKGMNYILDETGLSDEIPANWFGIEDDSVKFRLYDKANQGYLDMLGTQGIAIEKALELTEYYNMAITGQFTEDSYGTQRTKAILEEDADMARINAAVMTGYYGGLLPADVAYIVGQINKKIKKRSEVVEEED